MNPSVVAQMEYRCARCGAEPGERCRSKNGNYIGYPHASRWRQWKEDGFWVDAP